jgi:hypothetical protein
MKLYGIDNVRGGSYTQVELLDYQYECLKYEIRCVSDCCFKCGRIGHFASQCYESEEIEWYCERCDQAFETEKDCEDHESKCTNTLCARCGRNNHTSSECYAKKHINGYYLM